MMVKRRGRQYPGFKRKRVRIGRRVGVKSQSYFKRVRGTRMTQPRVRKFAKKHGLKPTRSLKRGGYGTYFGPGGKYLVLDSGKLRVKKRSDY